MTDADADPDPAIFVSDLQDVKQKMFFQIFFSHYVFKVNLHDSSKITGNKQVTKQ
jgi:hypothetical protein